MQPFLDIVLSTYCQLERQKYSDIHTEMSIFFFIWCYHGDKNELLLIIRSKWWPNFAKQLVEDLKHPVFLIKDNAYSTISSITSSESYGELISFLKTPLLEEIEAQIRSRSSMMKKAVIILGNLLLSGDAFVYAVFEKPDLIDALLAAIGYMSPNDEALSNVLEILDTLLTQEDEEYVLKFLIENVPLIDILCAKITDKTPRDILFKLKSILKGLFELGNAFALRTEESDNPFIQRVVNSVDLRDKIEQAMNHTDYQVKTAFCSLAYFYFDVDKSY